MHRKIETSRRVPSQNCLDPVAKISTTFFTSDLFFIWNSVASDNKLRQRCKLLHWESVIHDTDFTNDNYLSDIIIKLKITTVLYRLCN